MSDKQFLVVCHICHKAVPGYATLQNGRVQYQTLPHGDCQQKEFESERSEAILITDSFDTAGGVR